MNNEVDQKLKDRYTRAYAIIANIPTSGDWTALLIQVAKDLKDEEDKLRRKTDKSDFGGISDRETEKEKVKAEKREKDEEEAWGELNLDIPGDKKKT